MSVNQNLISVETAYKALQTYWQNFPPKEYRKELAEISRNDKQYRDTLLEIYMKWAEATTASYEIPTANMSIEKARDVFSKLIHPEDEAGFFAALESLSGKARMRLFNHIYTGG